MRRWGVREQLIYALLTRTNVLRVFFVVPDHTLLTHVQQVHTLATTLVLTAVFTLLFLREQQCSPEVVLVSALVASLGGSFASFGRLAFKLARNHGRRRRAYTQHKARRREMAYISAGVVMDSSDPEATPPPESPPPSPPTPSLPAACSGDSLMSTGLHWEESGRPSRGSTASVNSATAPVLIGGREMPSQLALETMDVKVRLDAARRQQWAHDSGDAAGSRFNQLVASGALGAVGRDRAPLAPPPHRSARRRRAKRPSVILSGGGGGRGGAGHGGGGGFWCRIWGGPHLQQGICTVPVAPSQLAISEVRARLPAETRDLLLLLLLLLLLATIPPPPPRDYPCIYGRSTATASAST